MLNGRMNPEPYIDPDFGNFSEGGTFIFRFGYASLLNLMLILLLLAPGTWLVFSMPEFNGVITRADTKRYKGSESCFIEVQGSKSAVYLPKRVFTALKPGDLVARPARSFFLQKEKDAYFLLSYWHVFLLVYLLASFILMWFPTSIVASLIDALYYAKPYFTIAVLLAIPQILFLIGLNE